MGANRLPDERGEPSSRLAYLLLAAIVLVGAVARFWNLNWDGGAYSLHPDEWALNEVVRRIVPDLNPHFFFYGSLPIYLYRVTAEVLSGMTGVDWLDRERLALVGRGWSAAASVALLPLLFVIGRRLWSVWAGLVAAACGAGAALLIQAAHFGTVDSLLTLEGALVLWLSLRLAAQPQPRWYVLVGVVVGLGMATKLTAATFIVMPVLAHFLRDRGKDRGPTKDEGRRTKDGMFTPHSPFRTPHSALHTPHLGRLALMLACAFGACVAASPYYLLDFPGLLDAIQVQSGEVSGSSLTGKTFSYTWQFVGSTPYLFELKNLVVWGLGLPLGVAALAGLVWAVVQIARWRRASSPPQLLLLLTTWPVLYLLLIGTWQARFVRHTLPLVPFFCLFAAGGVAALYGGATRNRGAPSAGSGQALWATGRPLGHRIPHRWIGRGALAVAAVVVAGALLWGAAFTSIYTSTDTRLAATEWIYKNVPAGSALVLEDKNQPLPVPELGGGRNSQYRYSVLLVTEADSSAKMDDFAAKLGGGDVLVSPNRRWSAALPRLAQFPFTGRYYELLARGELGYTPVATFASPPRLGPLSWPDDSAEETFQLFDHPTVRLYYNTGRLSAETLRRLLLTYPDLK